MSDGSNEIRVIDPNINMSQWFITRTITVNDQEGQPVDGLNELEVVGDKWIFAN